MRKISIVLSVVLLLISSYRSFGQCDPLFITCPADMVVVADDCYGADVYFGAIATPGSVVSYSPLDPGNHFPYGTTTITATAVNACQESASCSFLVTVNPPPPATVTCPADITVNATDCYGAYAYFPPANAQYALGIDEIFYSKQPGDFFPVGTTTVDVTARTACFDIVTCSFNVTVDPAPPATITCPADITVNADQCYGASVYFPSATAQYAFGIDDIYYSKQSGDFFPIGTTTVEVTARTYCFDIVTCSFNVTVEAIPPPTVTCPANITTDATQCSGAMAYYSSASAYYALGIDEIYYSTQSGDFFPIGTTTVYVTAISNCFDIATCTFDVTVDPPEEPTITCPADITVSAQSCQGSNVTFDATAYSLMGIAYIDYGTNSSGSLFPIGTTTVTATAYDFCGKSSSCQFDVTVSDFITVDAGPDTTSIFGYPSTQTIVRSAVVTGGVQPYSYSWTLSRPLKCNQVNSSGDELFTGGTCTANLCGSGSSTSGTPTCTGSNTINATLLDSADVCVTVTDATGCTASDCFRISAIDGRCFTGKAGKNKSKIWHQIDSLSNPWVTICIAKSVTNNYLANHPNDYLGPCTSRLENDLEASDDNLIFYPNPFNSIGTVRILMSEDVHGELELFSSNGAKVSSLYNGALQADEPMEFNFDASQLPGGIYLCKLTAGNEVYYVKAVLEK